MKGQRKDFCILKYALRIMLSVSSFFFPPFSLLREGSQFIAVTKAFLNVFLQWPDLMFLTGEDFHLEDLALCTV